MVQNLYFSLDFCERKKKCGNFEWEARAQSNVENLQLNGVMRWQFEIAFVHFICSDRFSMGRHRLNGVTYKRKMLTITFTQQKNRNISSKEKEDEKKNCSIQLRCVLCTAHNRHNILLRQFGYGSHAIESKEEHGKIPKEREKKRTLFFLWTMNRWTRFELIMPYSEQKN